MDDLNSEWTSGSYRYLSPSVSSDALAMPTSEGGVGSLEKFVLATLLRLYGSPAIRIRFWDGSQLVPAGVEPIAGLAFNDRETLWRFLINPAYTCGEGHSSGRLHISGGVVPFVETVLAARVSLNHTSSLRRFLLELPGPRRINTLRSAKRKIQQHYDIGNDFYGLWLDETLQYTCAYFPEPDWGLEAAQRAKMDNIARKVDLQPGERVLEVGCGWGGLALHLAQHYGVHVTAYNISHEQIIEARERAQVQGLDGNVSFVEDDYRRAEGQYDAFVSVGMLEHVGPTHYRTLGNVIHRTLKPQGRGLLHGIGQNRSERLNAWVEKRIFPGAYPPNLRQMLAVLEPHSLTVLDVENLRLHYAKTLEHWLARFEQHAAQIHVMFDEQFVRAWRYYLSASLASFRTDSLELFQILITRQGNNQVPWTRADWYRLN